MLDLAPITLVMLGGGVASWEGQAVGEKRDYYRLPAATLWGWHVPVCRLQPQVSLWSAECIIYLAKGWFHVKPLSHSGQAGPFRALLVILGHLGHPVGQWYAPQGVLGRRLHSASETLVQEKPYADGCGTVVL